LDHGSAVGSICHKSDCCVGGTFTDIYCEVADKDGHVVKRKVAKLLSEDPNNYKDAPTEGIRRILEQETATPIPRSEKVPTSQIEYIRMGTTVATNALLERKGERIALVTTKGFGDLQAIGNQSRPKIFDLKIRRPDLLYEHVVEVEERVILIRGDKKTKPSAGKVVTGQANETLHIETSLDEKAVEKQLKEVFDMGIKSIAVVLIHSYTFSDHEKAISAIAERIGFEQISLSSEVMSMVKMVPRGCTTCVDAYLTPVLKKYLRSFAAGFDDELGKNANVNFMQSDGGLTPMESFAGNRAILSGPAGGVVGYARTSYDLEDEQNRMPVIGFDMGGTSTDVSRYAGTYEHVFETTTAGVTIQSPQLDINTVAAGGGSRLFFRNGLFSVGPESAGAHPGPVCYRKGGPLAITDANVMLGRIQPHLFPSIFGEDEKQPLDFNATKKAFESLTSEINAFARANPNSENSKIYTVDEVAYGFIMVANEAMARPIRNLTTMKGYDVTKHALSTFGGAGPQHCCAIAKSLGIRRIYLSKYSGILSAYGLSLADVVVEKQEACSGESIESAMEMATSKLSALDAQAREELVKQGFAPESISTVLYLNCRYQGTDTAMMTALDEGEDVNSGNNSSNSSCSSRRSGSAEDYQRVFCENYKREYGFELTGRSILVDDVRVRATGKSGTSVPQSSERSNSSSSAKPTPKEHVKAYFDDVGRVDTPIYFIEELSANQTVEGPAIIIQDITTIVVEPDCTATVTSNGDLVIDVANSKSREVSTAVDPIYLSIFGHRFMGIAEQMGRTLQRTSISVNIKERLDFSCALFDPSGGLVANAPHLPVHLGAMSEAGTFDLAISRLRHWDLCV
jgi:5-oxoprolinase (ATP-hydrolysing)